MFVKGLLLDIYFYNINMNSLKYRMAGNVFNFEYFSDSLRENPHMFYTPSFTLLYSRKGEMRGTQNEGLFSGLD